MIFSCKGYCSYGNFFDHLCSGLKRKNHPNLKFLWYEDILKDLPRTVWDISNFLDRPLTLENLGKIANLLSFENMKKNPLVNPTSGLPKQKTFMRRGIVGDWRNHFNEDMNTTWNAWIEFQSHNDESVLKELTSIECFKASSLKFITPYYSSVLTSSECGVQYFAVHYLLLPLCIHPSACLSPANFSTKQTFTVHSSLKCTS